MPQSINILTLIAADLPSLDAIVGSLAAGTVYRTTTGALDQAVNLHEAHNRGIGRSDAKSRFLFDSHGQVVSVQLVAPVRMLAILGSEQFAHPRTQSGVPALVRTDFASQCLHRILLLVTGCIKPPLDSREAKLTPMPGDRMMPFF